MEFLLRPWRPADAAFIAVHADNPKIAANLRDAFPNPYTLADAEDYVNGCMENEGKNQMTRAIVADGEAVGSIGVFLGTDVAKKSAELGYWLAEPYWGRQIMRRAVRQVCEEAFAQYEIVRIFATPYAHNLGSCCVLEAAGFTCEGRLRQSVFKNGRILDAYQYALLREEVVSRETGKRHGDVTET